VSKCRFSAVSRVIGVMVVLMGSTLVPAAHGQQEVNPSWYDPWPSANKNVPHSSRAQVANRQKSKVSAVPAGRRLSGRRRKRSVDPRGTASMQCQPGEGCALISCIQKGIRDGLRS
jgi:hypothetical protein